MPVGDCLGKGRCRLKRSRELLDKDEIIQECKVMTDLPERQRVASNFSATSNSSRSCSSSDVQRSVHTKALRTSSLWCKLLASAFSLFEEYSETSSSHEKKDINAKTHGWSDAVKKAFSSGSMRRLQERFMGSSKTAITSCSGEVWLLGVCYKISSEDLVQDIGLENALTAFLQDFSSRIWITYRKGFDAIGDSKYTSDVNWGCMLRSSQMLVAQALLFHHVGRSWRKPEEKPYDRNYIDTLHLFGDSEECAFSIHNLLQAGKAYGLAAGSWVGPYAMCRSWETIARANNEEADMDRKPMPLSMVVYVVSGDEDGERGGAPVLCLEDAAKLCSGFCIDPSSWAPMLLLVPLVLGLDKINTRYIPLLWETFTFPQSLGILGGRPGASTYIVGVQDEKALYLDPHEVQQAVNISKENMEADTSSYHCNVVRHMLLETLDPSLAIGFYCRDKDDFDDFCCRASNLAEKSNGAPLFTVVQTHNLARPVAAHSDPSGLDGFIVEDKSDSATNPVDDDWQLL